MKILVVDDDPAILTLCATALRAQGHSVVECNAGNAALAAALREAFDVALCDLSLPDIHGLEIVRAIKMQAPDLPVIVMTALDPAEWEVKSSEAGADHFLSKPLRLDVLRHEVAMAGAARSTLRVAIQDDDENHRARLVTAFRQQGCQVTVVAVPLQLLAVDAAQLIIVDAGAPGAEAVVRSAGARGVPCFALFDANRAYDDTLLRQGASLLIQKPVEPSALLIQARFLASR